MGWGIRRSVTFGPLRVNLSNSGIGYSVGTRGFRLGKDAKGRKYRAMSIPGTGIYRRDYLSTPKHSNSAAPAPIQSPVPANTGPHGVRRSLPYIAGGVLLYGLLRAIF
jgi:hypothetical protein